MFKMPIAKYAIPTYYIIACAEVAQTFQDMTVSSTVIPQRTAKIF